MGSFGLLFYGPYQVRVVALTLLHLRVALMRAGKGCRLRAQAAAALRLMPSLH